MFSHIVLNDGQWSVGFVLDFNDLTSTDYKKIALERLWIVQNQNYLLMKNAPSYNNDLIVAQQIIKSLQERLLELESYQQGKDGWMDEYY